MDILEDKMQRSNYSSQEEILIPLPIRTFEELMFFEEQIKEVIFKDEAVRYFKNILFTSITSNFIISNVPKLNSDSACNSLLVL